jgi:hypothetical protein
MVTSFSSNHNDYCLSFVSAHLDAQDAAQRTFSKNVKNYQPIYLKKNKNIF